MIIERTNGLFADDTPTIKIEVKGLNGYIDPRNG